MCDGERLHRVEGNGPTYFSEFLGALPLDVVSHRAAFSRHVSEDDTESSLSHGLQGRRHSAGGWSALRLGRAAHSRPGRCADVREHGDCGRQRATAHIEEIAKLLDNGPRRTCVQNR